MYDLPIFLRLGVIKIKIDPEYNCNWWEECRYLLDQGIKYTFVKEIRGVTIWKFKKTAELFDKLSEFYSNVYSK